MSSTGGRDRDHHEGRDPCDQSQEWRPVGSWGSRLGLPQVGVLLELDHGEGCAFDHIGCDFEWSVRAVEDCESMADGGDALRSAIENQWDRDVHGPCVVR